MFNEMSSYLRTGLSTDEYGSDWIL
jgi:hypothetical protein